MPFGLGFGELLIVLLMYAVPAVILVVAARFLFRMMGGSRNGPDQIGHQQLVTELELAQTRIEELEARVSRVDEKATFTQDLIEKSHTGQD